MNPVTTKWIKLYKENHDYQHIRFKLLNEGRWDYPPFDIDETLTDKVDLEKFSERENTRLPLFIGTPMGVFPRLYYESEFRREERVVAVLGKSLLTGHVAGVSIRIIRASLLEETVLTWFDNDYDFIPEDDDL